MKIPIVNEQDEIIEYKERGEALPQDIQRISAVWIFNKNKEVLIQQRLFKKTLFPGKWSPSATGTVEKEETYEINAEKELEEELGLKNIELVPLKKVFYESAQTRRYCFVYAVYADIPKEDFVLQKSEVADVKWISIEDLCDWLKKSPDDFTPSLNFTLDLIKNYLNENKS